MYNSPNPNTPITHISLHAHTHTQTIKHLLVHIYTYLPPPTHTHTHAHTHTHTHTHSHTRAHSLSEFDASHNQLTKVPSQLFKMPELTSLHLSYNLLTHLPGDPDDPSAQSETGGCVYKFHICNNYLPNTCIYFHCAFFDDYSFLSTVLQLILVASYTCTCSLYLLCVCVCVCVHACVRVSVYMQDYHALYLPSAFDFFWRCDRLKKLDVSHNRLRALPDCFSDLKRLGTLSASHNYLKELPQSCGWDCINLVSTPICISYFGGILQS